MSKRRAHSRYWLCLTRQLGFGARPHERVNDMPAVEQRGNERPADVSGAARDEDFVCAHLEVELHADACGARLHWVGVDVIDAFDRLACQPRHVVVVDIAVARGAE